MRFMVIVKANQDTEDGVMPTEQELAEMGAYNEELVKAGIMLAGEGLHPSSKGARVRFVKGNKRPSSRAVRRDEGTHRRLLASRSLAGRGARVGQALPRRAGRRDRDSAGRSRPRTSATP